MLSINRFRCRPPHDALGESVTMAGETRIEEQQVREADDARQRRPQLVRYGRKEHILCAQTLLGCLAGLDQLIREDLSLRHIALGRDEAEELPGIIANRRDRHVRKVEGAILSSVDHLPLPFLAPGELLPDRAGDVGAPRRDLRKAGSARSEVFGAVACQTHEGWVYILDPPSGIGDHDAVHAGIHRPRQAEAQSRR